MKGQCMTDIRVRIWALGILAMLAMTIALVGCQGLANIVADPNTATAATEIGGTVTTTGAATGNAALVILGAGILAVGGWLKVVGPTVVKPKETKK
jgi:hypothetical protein